MYSRGIRRLTKMAFLALWLLGPLSACGPGPAGQEPASTPGVGAPGQPAGGGAPASADSNPDAQNKPLAAPPPYSDPNLRGLNPASIETMVRDLPRTRGRNGVLRFKSGQGVQEVQILEVSGGGLEPGGGVGFDGVVTIDGQQRYVKFIIGSDDQKVAQVQKILLASSNTQIPFTWSEARALWVAGPEEPLQ